MHERLRLLIWFLSAGGFGTAMGAVFGSWTAAVAHKNGNAAGGKLGRAIVAEVERTLRVEYSGRIRSILASAADGACFLGGVAALAGLAAGYSERVQPVQAFLVAGVILLLALAAALFGTLAYRLVRAGSWSVGGICVAALAGAAAGGRWAGADGIMIGTFIGAAIGSVPAMLWRSGD